MRVSPLLVLTSCAWLAVAGPTRAWTLSETAPPSGAGGGAGGTGSLLAPRPSGPLPAPAPVSPETAAPLSSGWPMTGGAPLERETRPEAAAPGGASVTAEPLQPLTPAGRPPSGLRPGVPPPLSLAPPVSAAPGGQPGASAGAPVVSQKLPTPALSPEAGPGDFLRAARSAVLGGRIGEARSALEMAQTRLLSRVIDAGKEREPSDDLAVRQIGEAISALVAKDRMNSVLFIERASATLGLPLN